MLVLLFAANTVNYGNTERVGLDSDVSCFGKWNLGYMFCRPRFSYYEVQYFIYVNRGRLLDGTSVPEAIAKVWQNMKFKRIS